MKRFLFLAACAAVLTACSKAEDSATVGSAPAQAPASAAAPPSKADVSPAAPAPAIAANLPALAYRHHYAIETPSRSVALLVDKHEAACQAAGPALCQVTGEAVRQESANVVTGTLSLRAQAGWLMDFRKGLAADAQAVGGKVASNETQTDELSRSMIDTDAAIAAKTAMRDRIQELVKTHKGSLDDLVDLEHQLADVQGEIDAARGNLAAMRGQVAMSQITIDYGPRAGLIEDGAWKPVSAAVRSAQGLMAATIGVIITFAAVLAPLALLGFALWLVGRRFGRPVARRVEERTAAP